MKEDALAADNGINLVLYVLGWLRRARRSRRESHVERAALPNLNGVPAIGVGNGALNFLTAA